MRTIVRLALRYVVSAVVGRMLTRFWQDARRWDLVWQEIPVERRDEILLHLVSLVQKHLSGAESVPASVVLEYLQEKRNRLAIRK